MTRRDQVLNLHNQGLTPDEIVAALSTAKSPLTKGEVVTKIAQCRREAANGGPPVRPDGVDAGTWCQNTQSKPRPQKIDLVALVKAWNLDPQTATIAPRFGLTRPKLAELIGRLRCKGVPLLAAKCAARELMAKVRDAALSVLTEDQKAELALPKRKAKVHNLPENKLVG
jgi:hypothetical protein